MGLLEQTLASVLLMDAFIHKGKYFLIFYPRGQTRRAGAPTPTGGGTAAIKSLVFDACWLLPSRSSYPVMLDLIS